MGKGSLNLLTPIITGSDPEGNACRSVWGGISRGELLYFLAPPVLGYIRIFPLMPQKR